jgi:hypothetical protein
MKLFTTFLLLFFSFITFSQNTCCDSTTVAPEVTTGFHTPQILGGASTPGVTLSVNASSDLPNTEYVVSKRHSVAVDNNGVIDSTNGQPSGAVIVGSNVSGIFIPDSLGRYGVKIHGGDTFDITAVGYDLNLVKTLADSLLNGSTVSGTPCCGLFSLIALLPGNDPSIAGFCDSVNNRGVYGASDINSFEDVLVIFDAFGGGQTSLNSVLYTLQTINSFGTFIKAECGGTGLNNFLSYGVQISKSFGYDREGTVAVQQLSNVSLFVMYPNPASENVMLRFNSSKTVDLSINIYDALGQVVYNQNLGSVNGDYSVSVPTADFSSGLYSVELSDGYSSQTQKLIIR